MKTNKMHVTSVAMQYIKVQSETSRNVSGTEWDIAKTKSVQENPVESESHPWSRLASRSGEAATARNLITKKRVDSLHNATAPTCQGSTGMENAQEDSNLEHLEIRNHLQSTPRTFNGTSSLMTLIRRRQQRRNRTPHQSKAVKCLQYFLSFLYFVGMSPIKPASAKQLPKWIARLQMALFWLFALTSILQALDELKIGCILFRVDENMLNFISLGFYSANLLTRIYYVKLLATSAKSTSCLMETIDNVNGASDYTNATTKNITIGIGALSLLLAVASTVFGYTPLNQWSLKVATLDRAVDLHESIFTWTSVNYTETLDNLILQYGTNITMKAGLFAAAKSFLTYCGTMHSCVLLDLWLIVSIQIYILQFHFTNAFMETKENNRTGKCPLSIHWQHYKRLRGVCEQSNLVFGKLLKMVHMQNLLLFGYFLFQLLKKDGLHVIFLTDILSVLKVSITYYLVQKSSEKNEMYEQCVIECSDCGHTIEMDGKLMNVVVLLKDMERHPIGIGRGDFYVNETFVLKFAAAVGSIFMLLSGEADDKKFSCACSSA